MLHPWRFSGRWRAMRLGPDSDVDLLVEFARPVGMFRFLAVKEYLEALLGRPVDLATRDALKRQFRDAILREAIYAS